MSMVSIQALGSAVKILKQSAYLLILFHAKDRRITNSKIILCKNIPLFILTTILFFFTVVLKIVYLSIDQGSSCNFLQEK